MSTPSVAITPSLQGSISSFEVSDHQVRISGWIFQTEKPFDRIAIALNGKPWAEAYLTERPDVAVAFEAINTPCPLQCGFDITAPLLDQEIDPTNTLISITPFLEGQAQDIYHSIYCLPEQERQTRPQPPLELQERIGGSSQFIEVGVLALTLISTYVQKYKPFSSVERILDWGCGCGRVIAQLTKVIPAGRIYDLQAQLAASSAEIAAMQSSKFWQLREQWFKFKKLLGR